MPFCLSGPYRTFAIKVVDDAHRVTTDSEYFSAHVCDISNIVSEATRLVIAKPKYQPV